jgi:tRNA/rRNA methyltransferase
VNDRAAPTPVGKRLSNVTIVLVRPKYPENVGAAARVALNMGISRLTLVRAEALDREKMLKTATHEAAHLIDQILQYDELAQALAPYSYTVGTTSRQGRKRRVETNPRQMVDILLPLLPENQVALLFGPEDKGLTNEDLQFCQLTVTIPTADFSSLNLAQAVAILCHELFYGVLHQGKDIHYQPKLASSYELEEMYTHVEKLLCTIGLLKTEDHTYWLRNLRRFLGRIGLRAKEARIIHGFCRQFLWYDRNRNSQSLEGYKDSPGTPPEA